MESDNQKTRRANDIIDNLTPEDEENIRKYSEYCEKVAAGRAIKERLLLNKDEFMRDRTGPVIPAISIDDPGISPATLELAKKIFMARLNRLRAERQSLDSSSDPNSA